MSEVREKVLQALSFLSDEECFGLLCGTLEALEEQYPGYVDQLVLGAIARVSHLKEEGDDE